MTFAFHAAPLPGEWMNDPNGLVFYDGRYRLWAQHSDTGPDFREINWGSWSSPDLLDWQWDGVAIRFKDGCSAYSGSVVVADGEPPEAWLTRHDHARRWQTQHRLTWPDWNRQSSPLASQGRNCRDPFVFQCRANGDWVMLIAEPCDWTDWRTGPPSRLRIWRSVDRTDWTDAGTIGLWAPPGVMWEVPVHIDFGDVQALIVSIVDRRGATALCSVRYWLGSFSATGFDVGDDFPSEGLPLDLGPDFYAAIPNVERGWPGADRVVVGWASNWAGARKYAWPGGIRGGPLSLPRSISCVDGRLCQRPVAAAAATQLFCWSQGTATTVTITGHSAALTIRITAGGALTATRTGQAPELMWTLRGEATLSQPGEVGIFIDDGLVEVFFLADGLTLTAFVPGAATARLN